MTIVVYLFVNVGFLCALSVEEIKSSSLIAETFAFKLAGFNYIILLVRNILIKTLFQHKEITNLL